MRFLVGGLTLTGAIGCGELEPGEPGDPAVDIDRSITGVGTCATATIAAVANRAIVISNVEAYAQKCVTAGETIDFRVSSPFPYQLSIVRLGWDTGTPVRDWTLHTFPQADASQQSIRPGLYVDVETALNPTATFTQLTLECWVRPFRTITPSYWQGLISQHTYSGQCGFGLFLSDTNVPHYYFGNGGDLGLGGPGRVHVASCGLDNYTVFVVGWDGRLKAKRWNGSAWDPSQTAWTDLGGSLVGEPAVASYRGSHLSVFGVAPDGRVQHILWNGSTWSEWQDFGGTMRHSPAVFRWVAT